MAGHDSTRTHLSPHRLRYSSGGPRAGCTTGASTGLSFDAALYVVERLYGSQPARGMAGGLCIDWDLDRIDRVRVEGLHGFSVRRGMQRVVTGCGGCSVRMNV